MNSPTPVQDAPSIKTWKERIFDLFAGQHGAIIAQHVISYHNPSPYMQAEIDDLRAALVALSPPDAQDEPQVDIEALQVDLAWHKESLARHASKLKSVWDYVEELRVAPSAHPDAQPVQDKPATELVCPTCGANRMQEACKGDQLKCGLGGIAYAAEPASSRNHPATLADYAALHLLLEWNRKQSKPPIIIGMEYEVAVKDQEFYTRPQAVAAKSDEEIIEACQAVYLSDFPLGSRAYDIAIARALGIPAKEA